MHTLLVVRYVNNKKHIVVRKNFVEFVPAIAAARSFTDLFRFDKQKRMPAVDGPIQHADMYADIYAEVSVLLGPSDSKLIKNAIADGA